MGGCGNLPAHGNSIALLDHIQDFYFCRRLYSRPHAILAARLRHLAGALMSHRQGRLARLVQPEVLGEPIADAIGSPELIAAAISRSKSVCRDILMSSRSGANCQISSTSIEQFFKLSQLADCHRVSMAAAGAAVQLARTQPRPL